ncbi:MAG TPA: hypothetical protein VFW95_07690 [Candidatus Limnocylindria bacterium]|nr:hypothetical protein [Candidatus Limnocylindria bacterium]
MSVRLDGPARPAASSLLVLVLAVVIAGCRASSPGAPVPPVASPSPSAVPSDGPVEPAATPAQAASPSFEGHAAAGLAFVQPAGAGSAVSHIFVVEADGSLRQVTGVSRPESTGATFPVWSPDGSRLLFAPPKIGGASNWAVSVVNADGSDERPVAPLQDEYTGPFSWSPDGTSILYGDLHEADGPMMWLADVASGERRYLGAGSVPRWAGAGDRITFMHLVEGPGDPAPLEPAIFVMGVEDAEPSEFARALDAVWAPDGSAVLIQAAQDRLLMAGADGSNASDFVQGWSPAWSPDGNAVVFAFDHDANGLPVLAAVDRSGQPLWAGAIGASPAWSPDGTRIAVEISYPEPMIQVLDAATGELLWEGRGSQPAWRP